MLERYFLYSTIILLLVALFVGYSVNLFSLLKTDQAGKIIFEQKTVAGEPTKLAQLIESQNYLGWENFSKRDLFFVSWYRVKLHLNKDLDIDRGHIPRLEVSFSLPGEVIKHNATRIEKETAVWEDIPSEGVFVLETRLIRWWLIVFTLILVFLTIWLKRQRSEPKGRKIGKFNDL